MIVTIKNCLNCNNKPHEWLFDGLTLKELRIITKLTGMTKEEFAKAGDDGNLEALAALLYILHLRSRIEIPFEEIDLDFASFDTKLTPEEQAEKDAAEKRLKGRAVPKSRKSGPETVAA